MIIKVGIYLSFFLNLENLPIPGKFPNQLGKIIYFGASFEAWPSRKTVNSMFLFSTKVGGKFYS